MSSLEYISQNLFLKSFFIGLFASAGLTLLGIFIVLRKAIFITLAISEVALLGLVLGLMVGINPYFSMIIVTILGLIIFSFYKTNKNFSEDILVGVIYAVSFSLIILFLSKTTYLESHILNSLSGNILVITNFDIILSFICCLIIILFFIFFNKQLFFMYSDKETSLAYNINYKLLNFLFFLLVGINIVSFLRSIGMILSFSYLCIPSSFVLGSSKNIRELIYKSLTVSFISTILGIIFSFIIDLPLGPTIVVFLFICGILFNKIKG